MATWSKVPSVTTGGKAYFYTMSLTGYSREAQATMGLGGRVWVVWNRRAKKWEAITEDGFKEKSLGLFKDAEEAKRFVEARLSLV